MTEARSNSIATEITTETNLGLITLVSDVSEYFHSPETAPQYMGWKYSNETRNHAWVRMKSNMYPKAEARGSFWFYNWSN